MPIITMTINVEVPEGMEDKAGQIETEMEYSFSFKGKPLETHFIDSEIKDDNE